MDDKMCKPNHLLKRGSVYYVRIRIPTDLLDHFHPKKELVRSLRTSDYREASIKVRTAALSLLKEFEELRTRKKSQQNTITQDEIKRLSDLWVAHLLEEDEELRFEGLTDKDFSKQIETQQITEAAFKDDLARGNWRNDALLFEMDDFVESHGFHLDKSSADYRNLAVAFLKASVSATERVGKRNQGEVVETPKAASVVPSGASDETPFLSTLVTRFLGKADSSKPMYKKYRVVLPLFLEYVGDRQIDKLRQLDIENFCHFICKLPPRWSDQVRQRKISITELTKENHEKTISPKTYEDTYIAGLRPFLNEAIRVFGDQGFPRHLTTDGITYSGKVKAGENKQRAMTEKEIKLLFEGEYMTRARANVETEHEFWFPLVGLYTGARVNEVCQLNPQSDIREEYGIWCFAFTDEGETDERVVKSVKNAVSRRQVPIHGKLLELGFLKYVERIKTTGVKLLFPQWIPTVGVASAGAREWFSDLLKELKLRDDTLGKKLTGYHTFRHTMENRALNLDVANLRLIVGHAGEKTAVERGYEGELELVNKKRILDRIWFNLDLPVIP